MHSRIGYNLWIDLDNSLHFSLSKSNGYRKPSYLQSLYLVPFALRTEPKRSKKMVDVLHFRVFFSNCFIKKTKDQRAMWSFIRLISWLTGREQPYCIGHWGAMDRYSKPFANDEEPLLGPLGSLPSCCAPRRSWAKVWKKKLLLFYAWNTVGPNSLKKFWYVPLQILGRIPSLLGSQ